VVDILEVTTRPLNILWCF